MCKMTFSCIVLSLVFSCHSPSKNEKSRNKEEVCTDSFSNLNESTDNIDSVEIDSNIIKQTEKKLQSLKSLMIQKNIHELVNYIQFPLDARSADAFGCEAETIEVQFTEKQFVDSFDIFFTKFFIDSLEAGSEKFEIYIDNDQVKWLLMIYTFEPPTEERDWGIECSRKIFGKLEGKEIFITGFSSLCGGIL